MNFLYENIWIIIALICVVGAGVYLAYKFMLLPSDERKTKILAFLLLAVTEAETELGGNTGQLKLVYVYSKMIEKFPVVSKLIPYATFKLMVDEALETMKELIKKNQDIADIVKGE